MPQAAMMTMISKTMKMVARPVLTAMITAMRTDGNCTSLGYARPKKYIPHNAFVYSTRSSVSSLQEPSALSEW